MRYFGTTAIFLAFATTILITGCSSNQPQPDKNTETFVNQGSEVPFPHALNDFVRTQVLENSPDYPGPAAEYYLRKDKWEVFLSVSVYAAPMIENAEVEATVEKPDEDAESKEVDVEEKPDPMRERMLAINEEILESGSDEEHRFISRYDISVARGKEKYQGKKSYFRHENDIFTNIHLFEYGDWYIEYRATYDRDLEWLAEDFVQDHPWIAKTE